MNCIYYNILVFRNKMRSRVSFNKVVYQSNIPKYYLTPDVINICWWNTDDYVEFMNCYSLVVTCDHTKKVSFNKNIEYSKNAGYTITQKIKNKCWWNIEDYDTFLNYAIVNYMAKNKI